ncbi:MAG: ATP-binding cassette domain-containing protein [Puniceicoccales bacterium]|jgi:peptide/nickel transport system ATP-binding protein/oligopeptide transport system ATP-binding protein|nr:ATP-binding cassette domain-containing protein [Puniceicoccales bacterium]
MEDTSQRSSSSTNVGLPLVEVRHLYVSYEKRTGIFWRKQQEIAVVEDVSFRIVGGMTMGLVGESGSGKTTLAKALVRLVPFSLGEIFFAGKCLSKMSHREFFPYRKRIQMIFQDPLGSLDPRMTISHILEEPLRIHFKKWSPECRRCRTVELLAKVGLEADTLTRYPHEFSGGQRQRIGIARALAVEPEFLICDEPVSALDVSVQAQILNLLKDIQKELGLTYLFIAHDLAVIEYMSDEIMVMHEGQICERASADVLYRSPRHPYTRRLLQAVPPLGKADVVTDGEEWRDGNRTEVRREPQKGEKFL